MDPESNAQAKDPAAAQIPKPHAEPAHQVHKIESHQFAQFKDHASFNFPLAICWLVAAFSIFATIFFWWLSKNAEDALVEKVADKDSIVAQISSPTYSKVEKEAADFKESVNQLKTAYKDKYTYSKFLPELYKHITKDVVLSNISISNDGTISISGKTKTYRSVADLVVALKSWDVLAQVDLLSTANTETEKGNIETTFSISMKLDKTKSLTTESNTTSMLDQMPLTTIGGTDAKI